MLSSNEALIATLIISAVTFFVRALPFLMFRNKQPNDTVVYIGKYAPAVIITILVIYCLKGAFYPLSMIAVPQLICLAVVIGLHLKFRNSLISIFGGTILYMVLVQVVFI